MGSTTFGHWETIPGESARFSTAMKHYRGSRPSWYDWMDMMSVFGHVGLVVRMPMAMMMRTTTVMSS